MTSALSFLGVARDDSRPRYRAFLSYSHADARIARWLHRAIESYAVPRSLVGQPGEHGPVPRRLAPVFCDEEELGGAAELGPKLRQALADSAALIVICSPPAARSVWVCREIELFKRLHPDRPVLAMIASGAPDGDDGCFPHPLRCRIGPDQILAFDPSIEPLAPDLQKQDRSEVRLKLVAALLGVRYADLRRRDLKRTRARAAAFGGVGLVVMLALTTLSIVAVSYARMAVHQRDLARRAQAEAEHNADLAERRAWLAQTAAEEIRRQAIEIDAGKRRH